MTDSSLTAALRLGFARGTAPNKWARRWAEMVPDQPLELIPLTLAGAVPHGAAEPEVRLERVAPGLRPESASAVRLYTEGVALVVAADHELAGEQSADPDALALVTLLDHPDHCAAWPHAQPWADPDWAPVDAAAAMDLVATGLGAILLPLPLARHLASKREHAVLPVRSDPPLIGTEIWVCWNIDRDAPEVQQLVSIMRGRTVRSGRASGAAVASEKAAPEQPRAGARGAQAAGRSTASQQRSSSAKPLPKNSRGAQLAAAQAKRDAQRRAKRKKSR